MKKLLGIVVLGLLLNSSLLAEEKFTTLECKLIDDDINIVQNIDIDLEKRLMNNYYKISSVTDSRISAFSDGSVEGDGVHREYHFDRYKGTLLFIYYGIKIGKDNSLWEYNCKKLDKTKKVF